jgi:predicted aminopeptidase
MLRIVVLMLCASLLSGCYYVQAAQGQWELTRKREPIDKVLAREDTSDDLAARLQLVKEARQFAVDELGLPDNDTYRSYADLQREFVVWNVFAAPEFSLEPKTWCYPIVGCVSYRGYFRKADAERQADRLRSQGYDVAVGGVAAYSTLGKLNDPVLNTMMNWDDTQLVAVLFHELSHQVLYVKGDSGFNESFATAVEEFGVQRWLAAKGWEKEYADYEERRKLRQDIMSLVAAAREDLESIYAQRIGDEEKRQLKSDRLATLQRDVAMRLEQNGHDTSNWLAGELNNARLVPMILYEGRLEEFRDLLRECEQDLNCFYARAADLAES